MPRELTRLRSRRLKAGAIAFCLCVTSVIGSGVLRAAPRQQQLEKAKDRLLELEKDFELVVERYNATHDELISLQAQIAKTRLVVEDLQKRMDARQSDAISLAQELYKSGSAGASLEPLLDARSLSEVESTVSYLRASEQANAKVFEELAVDRAVLNKHIAMLEEDRAKAAAAEERLSNLRAEIEDKVHDQKGEIRQLNEAIARAERRREAAARAAAAAARASAASSGVIAPLSVPPNPAPAPNPAAQTAVNAALSQVGKPYQWGAAGPDAYDCSGLTMWAWAQAGVGLPHNSGQQYAATPRVAQSDLAPGDLLFFGSPIHHVGMYIGNGQMVEAPYTGAYVRVTSASRSDYVGAGRPGV